jgi:hypothetical protein
MCLFLSLRRGRSAGAYDTRSLMNRLTRCAAALEAASVVATRRRRARDPASEVACGFGAVRNPLSEGEGAGLGAAILVGSTEGVSVGVDAAVVTFFAVDLELRCCRRGRRGADRSQGVYATISG